MDKLLDPQTIRELLQNYGLIPDVAEPHISTRRGADGSYSACGLRVFTREELRTAIHGWRAQKQMERLSQMVGIGSSWSLDAAMREVA